MSPIVECALQTLKQHPHPALRLSELLEVVAERIDRTLDAGRLRGHLEDHPSLFRLLDPSKGPWREPSHARTDAFSLDPWVLISTDPAEDSALHPSALLLRESVRWLGRGLDPYSPRDVNRWYAIALAERQARVALRGAAAA